jgi:small subunit ribosomal protein S17
MAEKTNETPENENETPEVEAETSEAVETPEVEAETSEVVETPEAEAPTEETAVEDEPEAAVDEGPAEPEAAAEEAPAETSVAAEAPAEPQAQSGPKPKRKRLPRRLRPEKTRPQRAATTGARKPIVREPKPEHERGRSQERRGVVVSNAMDKTIVVKVDMIKSHPKYKKVVRRSAKFHAHDEQNAANVGDVVRIVETRPLSATKRWRLAEIVEVAK